MKQSLKTSGNMDMTSKKLEQLKSNRVITNDVENSCLERNTSKSRGERFGLYTGASEYIYNFS